MVEFRDSRASTCTMTQYYTHPKRSRRRRSLARSSGGRRSSTRTYKGHMGPSTKPRYRRSPRPGPEVYPLTWRLASRASLFTTHAPHYGCWMVAWRYQSGCGQFPTPSTARCTRRIEKAKRSCYSGHFVRRVGTSHSYPDRITLKVGRWTERT